MLPRFPKARRRRGIIIATAVVAAMPVTWSGPVTADDLQRRKHAVEQRIDRASEQLDQSSSTLVDATRALTGAEGRLRTARSVLTSTRGRLVAALALDTQAQTRLQAAVKALQIAQEEVTDARSRIADQEADLRQVAVTTYQSVDPSLMALSMILTSSDPAELTGQLNSVQSVLAKESATLDRLEATRSLLIVRERDRETARARVAQEREAAAENLLRRKLLEQQARQAEADVEELVRQREEQRVKAVRARADDLRQLRELQRERDRVATMLQRRAEAARRRAAAAERAGRLARSDGSMAWPVSGWISSPFGMRLHPVYKRWSLHDGIDIASSCGSPVRAASSGQVVARYYNSAYGNRVIIDNGFQRGVGVATTYNHMSGFSAYVGQAVEQGDVIGYVGTTGASTGCHLHFMVVENGTATNPMSWL